jgi:hypothetical protein
MQGMGYSGQDKKLSGTNGRGGKIGDWRLEIGDSRFKKRSHLGDTATVDSGEWKSAERPKKPANRGSGLE